MTDGDGDMMIDERMAAFIGSFDCGNTSFLEALEQEALESNVPIIRSDTQNFLKLLLSMKKPMRILEVGCAVGFSALLMSEYAPEGCQITTIEKYEKSISNVKKQGFNIIETPNVRTDGVVSSDKVTRARELESLFLNTNADMVAIASGGDFLYDMLTEVDFSILTNNVKWLAGSSDPTSLLYILTTNYDIATVYSPCNMSGFNEDNLHESYLNYFKILKGNLVKMEIGLGKGKKLYDKRETIKQRTISRNLARAQFD